MKKCIKGGVFFEDESPRELLLTYGIATEDEIELVEGINGSSEETYNDILFVRTGYRDFEQFLEG